MPILLIISILVLVSSPGGIFYKQVRVGKNGKEFGLLKFRSMRAGSDAKGQLTVGNDARVTGVGRFIRRFKLDEFPQLLNIIAGQMSIVGPRPEVPKYVALYNEKQQKVLSVLPGLTDIATIEYIKEQEILGKAENPEQTYIDEVMPAKLDLNLQYVEKANFWFDIYLIFKTIGRIFR
ncbi:sugar transferase [Paracrocinitomix mangrovi]|nr:sugar transferase [Paracrocinitomix mangrovi]